LKRKVLSILFALVLVLSLTLVTAVPAGASPETLIATGDWEEGLADEARIVIPGDGMTLGELTSISWSEYLLEGYPPHVDIILDMGESVTDALVIKYAYNGHDGEGQPTYGAIPDAWYQTFGDDELGPEVIDDTAYAWLTTQAAGGDVKEAGEAYESLSGGFYKATLADWVSGEYIIGIGADTPIMQFEIEVDNWMIDSIAIVDNILINAGSVVGMTVVTVLAPDIVAISVSPTNIDFGTLYPGQSSGTTVVTVENVGTVTVDVGASVIQVEGAVFTDGLWLDGDLWTLWTPLELAFGVSEVVNVQLDVPSNYNPIGPEEATLIFEATTTP